MGGRLHRRPRQRRRVEGGNVKASGAGDAGQVMSKLKLAFLGFRHGHIMGLYTAARKHKGVTVTAACEQDEATADALRAAGTVELTHVGRDCAIRDLDCDAVAVGDYFSKRGPLII